MRFLTLLATVIFVLATTVQAGERVAVSYRFTTRTATKKIPYSYSVKPASSHSRRPVQHIMMRLTGYCPCQICCEKTPHDKNYGVTAKGKNAFIPNGVAADFGLLPPGTKISIPGIGLRVVDDTGRDMRAAARQGIYHIDVRMKTHRQASKINRWVKVAVIR